MGLGSNQPLADMSKDDRCVRLTNLIIFVRRLFRNLGASNVLETSGLVRDCIGVAVRFYPLQGEQSCA